MARPACCQDSLANAEILSYRSRKTILRGISVCSISAESGSRLACRAEYDLAPWQNMNGHRSEMVVGFLLVHQWWSFWVHSSYTYAGGERLIAVAYSAAVCCICIDGSDAALRHSVFQTQNITNFPETQRVRSKRLSHVGDTSRRSENRMSCS
jgi:hypothetical protein